MATRYFFGNEVIIVLVLITYDVNTESSAGRTRLRKVAKQCENYGRRVQNSVFECILDQAQCVMLKSLLSDIIDEDVDQSIRNLTRIGSQAMNETDKMVLDIMTHKGC